MNELTRTMTTNLIPDRAIIVYKTDEQANHESYYLESHKIDSNGKMLEGNPLTEKTLSDIAKNFTKIQDSFIYADGLLPDHVLLLDNRVGVKKFAWYRPAEKKMMYFSKALNIKSGLAWVPALLYIVDDYKLNVYALKDNKRPTIKTKLFRAPFHNIDSDGDVCLGNAKVKQPIKNTIDLHIKYWEDKFWLSEFSHILGGSSPTKTNINTIWKNLLGTEKKFPIDQFVNSKIKTLQEAI